MLSTSRGLSVLSLITRILIFTDRDFKVWVERGVFKVIRLTTGRSRLKPMCLNLCSEKATGHMENSDFEFHWLEVLVFSSIKWG